jgi:hypothetical protein
VKNTKRFWLACALSPLSVPAIYVVQSLFTGSGFKDPFIAIFASIVVVSYVGFLVFGLPFVRFLRAKVKLTYVALFLGGLLAGPMFTVFMQVWSGDEVTFRGAFAQVAMVFSLLSVTVAMVFGLIAKARFA